MYQIDRFDIPLQLIDQEYMRVFEEWDRLNKELPDSISQFVKDAEQSSFALKINIDRFKLAVGFNEQPRMGLVFESLQQQQDFIADFQQCMSDSGYESFSLVATGSSFQGLSTNPFTFQKLGYMKFCGQTGSTDLDLQIYCAELFEQSIAANLPAFNNHLKMKEIEGKKYARLMTFDNKNNPEKAAPYLFIPSIKNFERAWTEKLKRNFLFTRTGIEFEGVSIALMTEQTFKQQDSVGSPYQLYP